MALHEIRKNLYLIGAGGHAAEVYEWLITGQSVYRPVGCLVTSPSEHPPPRFDLKVCGKVTDFPDHPYVPAIGSPDARRDAMQARGKDLAVSLVHRSAFCPHDGVWTAKGVVVAPGAHVGKFNHIDGEGCVFHRNCTVTHDCYVGPYAFIGPGAVLCGGARVEKFAFVGAGAVVGPRAVVEEGAILGSGASLPQTKRVPAGRSYAGNPARPCLPRAINPFGVPMTVGTA